MLDFEQLRSARRAVGDLVALHGSSISVFRAANHSWFKLSPDEVVEDTHVRHKSTTASCLESLGDTRPTDEARQLIADIAVNFATHALNQTPDEWESEAAAWVYCRVRTLPAILTFARDEAINQAEHVEELVDYVWSEVNESPRHQGVYERPGLDQTDLSEKQHPSYPPNAFQTFWALRTLQMCGDIPKLARVAKRYERSRNIALLWTQSVLGSQIALHKVGSERADPNQLAWALIAQFVNPAGPAEPAVSEFARRDLYKAALHAFFDQQLADGTWSLGQPLFHYPKAGNAYCYTFETLTELLRPALYRDTGRLLRELLLEHSDRLLRSFEYARKSCRPIGEGVDALGWSSGHHPHRTEPEGWATAAVFSFCQCLRRLLGVWTHEHSARSLRARPAQPASRTKALADLQQRGDTWRDDGWAVSEQFAALFLHPRDASTVGRDDPMDPDLELVEENEARSAILYGPPGTSKTTLVEALAAAINWQFVEIHASDFLSRGMDHVPARADEIFNHLMELDHCVVLFDEVDELLRERLEAETDPFGRFLTTSMLPKLAQLWKQRRVLFFVATNDIVHADRAIKRSQRFDATIFVPPPSWAIKRTRLVELLGGKTDVPRVSVEVVEEALAKRADENPLGYLALMRYDQLDELAAKLRVTGRSKRSLEASLQEIGEQISSSDWQHSGGTDTGDDAFVAFRRQREVERRDYGRALLVACLDAAPPPSGFAFVAKVPHEESGGETQYWRVSAASKPPPEEIVENGWRYTRDTLLRYGASPNR